MSVTTIEQQELPPLFFDVEPSTSNGQKNQMSSTQLRQVLAQAVIERLQHWCMQLFWMTVFCVINCCGDETSGNQINKKSLKKIQKTPTKTKPKMEDIEQKLLRHLTPYLSSPLRPVHRATKKRVLSRPPSPQLFDIAEED